jgi:hypothetical protein
MASTLMYVQPRELFQSYPDQLEPFLVFNNTAFNRSSFLQMLPDIEVQTFCKRVVEIDGSNTPGYVQNQLNLDKTVCVQHLERQDPIAIGKIGYRNFRWFNKDNGTIIPLTEVTYLMNSTLYFLTETEYLLGQDWYYKSGLNYERFCVQIVLAMESNKRLAYEWKIMQEYTNCLIKDKMLYAMGVIEEFHPNFSFCIPLPSKRRNMTPDTTNLPKGLK